MNVTLLGTSAAEGWPGLFCDCDACGKARALGGKNIRTRSSALIDNRLKIDFPPDTLYHVIHFNLNLRCLSALLFTHAHDDHFSPQELQYLGPHFITRPLEAPLAIYGPDTVIQRLEPRLDPDWLPVTLHTLKLWETTLVGSYQVTPVLAQHDPKQTCFNYLITDSAGKTLLYASDTGWYEEPTWKFLSGHVLDGIVVECTKGMEEGGYLAHLSIPDVIRMRQKLLDSGNLRSGAPVVTTHFSHWGGLMHHELEDLLTPHGITVGYDGVSISLT